MDLLEPTLDILGQEQTALLHDDKDHETVAKHLVTISRLDEAEYVSRELFLLPIGDTLAELPRTAAQNGQVLQDRPQRLFVDICWLINGEQNHAVHERQEPCVADETFFGDIGALAACHLVQKAETGTHGQSQQVVAPFCRPRLVRFADFLSRRFDHGLVDLAAQLKDDLEIPQVYRQDLHNRGAELDQVLKSFHAKVHRLKVVRVVGLLHGADQV